MGSEENAELVGVDIVWMPALGVTSGGRLPADADGGGIVNAGEAAAAIIRGAVGTIGVNSSL